MDLCAGLADQSVSFAAYTTATGAPVTVTSATGGLSLWYRRGVVGAKTAISVSDLALLTTAHTDGGILVIQGAEHRLDLPDAACAAGVLTVEWGGTATGITIDGGTANLIGQANSSPTTQEVAREAHSVSGTVYHVKYNAGETMGNDALSWATADLTAGAGVKTDIEAATAGDLVLIGAGTFALGTAYAQCVAGTRIKGAGIDATIIQGTNASGPVISPKSNVTIEDLTISGSAGYGISVWAAGAITNLVLRNVRVYGDGDGFHSAFGGATSCAMRAYNCEFNTLYDAVAARTVGDFLQLFNCTLNATGPYTGGEARGVNADNGTVWLWNCNVNAQDGYAGLVTAGLYAVNAGNIVMFGGSIRTSNAAGTDLAVLNAGSGKIVLIGVDYDRAKMSNTGGGTITDIARVVTDTAGNAYADIRKVVARSVSDPGADSLYIGTWSGMADVVANKIRVHHADVADAVLDEALASHDTEDSVGNVLNDLTEESGGTYRLTATALAGAPTGSTASYTVSETTVGTSPTVNLTGQQYMAFGPFAITATTAQTGDSHRLMVYAADAPATILWSLTTADGEISVGGSGNLTLTISDTDAHTATAGTWRYRLVNTTDDVEICRGALVIEEGPNVPT